MLCGFLRAAFTAALLVCFTAETDAAEDVQPPQSPAASARQGTESLAQEAEDPTASLMALQIADWYTASFHGLDGEDANSIVLRPVMPFRTGPLNHILRVTMPFITDHPVLNSGLSDTTVFDLLVFSRSWGRWGVGPVALIPTGGANRGTEKWALGPALGFTARTGKLLWGAFNQNLFTFAGAESRRDVNVSVLQPILNYGLGGGWAVGNSEMTFTYDWEDGRWASLPLGAKVSKLVHVAELPVQFQVQYERDFADDVGTPRDTVRFSVKLLFPGPGS